MMILAEASNAFAGQALYITLAFIGGLGGLLAIASFFATRNEVADVKERVGKLEEKIDDSNILSETHREKLHKRINRILIGVSRIQGRLKIPEDHAGDEGDDL